MILDNENLFSDKQAIVATAPSTNIIDLQVAGKTYLGQQLTRNVGNECIPFLVSVNEAFNTLTSLTITIQGSSVEGFGSGVVDFAAQTIPLAQLKVGKKFAFPILPANMIGIRYLRINYTVTGTPPTTGKVTAGVVGAVDLGYYGNV
jgi:hypothetical protein